MRTLTVIVRRIIFGATGLCLTALPAAAQLYSYHAAMYTEGNIFFYGEADNDEFAHAVATGDFNGDGADDLATGVPYDDNAGALYPSSGIVIVRYGVPGVGLKEGLATTVLTQFVGGSPDPPGNNDYFGWSLASGDFNGDGYDDLAVGVVGEESTGRAGAVQVYRGSAAGIDLNGVQFFTQETPGISGESENVDYFGFSLAAGNFDDDAFDDLAISVIWEDSDFDIHNGRVIALYGSGTGLSASRAQSFDQDTSGMDGSCEDYDIFGSTMAVGDFNGDGRDDLVVGVPGENDGGGGIQVIFGSLSGLTTTGNNLWTQDDPGVPDTNETGDHLSVGLAVGDFNGDGYDDIAAGARYEDLDLSGTVSNAGAVTLFFGSSAGISGSNSSMWTASGAGLDPSETGDEWGRTLAAGDFDHDGYADLAIGAPYETLASGPRTGQVTILRGSSGGLTSTGGQLWHQDFLGVPDSNEQGDEFARALAVGDFDGNGHADLVIGAPRESTTHYGNGAEWVLYGFIFGDGFETGNTGQWEATQSSILRNTNHVGAATAAKLGTSASQYGLSVSLVNGATNSVYVMAGPARGFNNDTALTGTFFIDPQGLTMSTTTGLNSFQTIAFNDGVGAGSKTRLVFSLVRATADGWFINVSHWNDNTASFQFSGGGFLACAASPCGNPADWHNNRIDFEWTRGNPGHLTMWRTRYVGGAPDASGKVQMFSVDLPGMQNAVVNNVFAGMFSGQDAGTFGSLYLDEFSFSR
ncbi:MAG TPA: hypothetical protein VGX68_04835 [Thermoanaerobaculia bacterium]|jgi:hypothetical protein|nr:hypothetical protein [Thermoanaerobaculia bacterium]